MANESFDEFLKRGINYNGGSLEYFEDTHDAAGNYIGGRGNAAPASPSAFGSAPSAFGSPYTPPQQPQQQYAQAQPQQQVQYAQPQYTAPQQAPQNNRQFNSDAARRTENDLSRPTQFKYTTTQGAGNTNQAVPLPDLNQFISPRMYQNIAMYAPQNGADVERLIDFLRRREPAIIDLDPISDTPDAQRILDFTSGAVYALGGCIVPMKGNSFIVVPDGITIVRTESD